MQNIWSAEAGLGRGSFFGLLRTLPKKWLLLNFSILFLLSSANAAEPRTWSAAEGSFKVEAEFVSQTDSEVVLKRTDGPTIRVPKTKLSPADQELLRQYEAKAKEPAAANTPATATKKKLTGEEIAVLKAKFLQPTKAPEFVKVAEFESGSKARTPMQFAKGGKYFAETAYPQKMLIWNLETGKLEHDFKTPINLQWCWNISPNGKYLIYANREKHVVVFDIAKQSELYIHKAAATAEQRPLQVMMNWAETEVYFLTTQGTVFRFQIGGGQGKSVVLPITSEMDNPAEPFDVSADGDFVISLTKNHPFAGVMLPLPKPEEQKDEQRIARGPMIFEQDPKMRVVGCALNYGMLMFDVTDLKRTGGVNRYLKSHDTNELAVAAGYHSFNSRLMVSKVAVDRNEKYAWALGLTPHYELAVDIFFLNQLSYPITVPIPRPDNASRSDFVWISPENKIVLRHTEKDRKFHIYRLSEFEHPPYWTVFETLESCLLNQDYDALERLLEPLLTSTQPIPGGTGFPAMEEIVHQFNNAQFYEGKDEWFKRLLNWQLAKPNSSIARMVGWS